RFSLLAGASVATAADNLWTNGAADFVWDGSSANWTSPTSWVNGDDAVFGASGIGTISLGAGVSANSLTFNSAGYSLGGTGLTLTGASVTAAADATISAPLGGSAGLTKAGGAILTLSGENTYSGTTLIQNGTLNAANASGAS